MSTCTKHVAVIAEAAFRIRAGTKKHPITVLPGNREITLGHGGKLYHVAKIDFKNDCYYVFFSYLDCFLESQLINVARHA